MKQIFTFLIIFFSASSFSLSQTRDISPLAGRLLISAKGGITIPQTDFKNLQPGPFGLGDLEYYFGIRSRHSAGIRLQGGGGTIKGGDDVHIPSEYSDNFFFIGGGLVYSYAVNYNFLPYIFLGVSNVWYNPQDKNGASIIADKPASESVSKVNYGGELGLRFFLSEHFAINVSAGEFICPGDQLDGLSTGHHDDVFLYGSIGVTAALFGETDSDGDGVWDSEDACPGTPQGVKVDITGCPIDSDNDGIPDYTDNCEETPAGVKVDASGCPLDKDKDGVPDYIDNCPDSPAGIPVNTLGCIKDSDNDGVPDYQDKCPETPAGTEVNDDGCPGEKNVPVKPEIKEPSPEPKAGEQGYNLQNEYLVRDMIFTDGNQYNAQISAWRTESKAESEVEKLKAQGYDAFVTTVYISKWDQTWYRVRVGYFSTFNEARELAHKLR